MCFYSLRMETNTICGSILSWLVEGTTAYDLAGYAYVCSRPPGSWRILEHSGHIWVLRRLAGIDTGPSHRSQKTWNQTSYSGREHTPHVWSGREFEAAKAKNGELVNRRNGTGENMRKQFQGNEVRAAPAAQWDEMKNDLEDYLSPTSNELLHQGLTACCSHLKKNNKKILNVSSSGWRRLLSAKTLFWQKFPWVEGKKRMKNIGKPTLDPNNIPKKSTQNTVITVTQEPSFSSDTTAAEKQHSVAVKNVKEPERRKSYTGRHAVETNTSAPMLHAFVLKWSQQRQTHLHWLSVPTCVTHVKHATVTHMRCSLPLPRACTPHGDTPRSETAHSISAARLQWERAPRASGSLVARNHGDASHSAYPQNRGGRRSAPHHRSAEK